MGENGTSDSLPTSTSSKKKGPQIILPSLPRSIYKPQIPLSPLLTSTLKMPIKKNEEEKQEEEEEEEDFQLAYITEDDSTFACKAINNTDEFNLKANSKDENKEQLVLQVNLQTMQSKFKHPRGEKSNDNNHVKNEEQLVSQIKNSAPSTSKAYNSNLQTIQSNSKPQRGKTSNVNNHVKNEKFEKQVSNSPKNSYFLRKRGGEKSSQKRKINVETRNNKKTIKKAKIEEYYYTCAFCKKDVDDLEAHTNSRHQSEFFKNDDDANNHADNDTYQEDIAFSTNRIITRNEATDNEYQVDDGWFCEFCEKEVDDLEDHVNSRHQSESFNEEAEDSWFWHCDL